MAALLAFLPCRTGPGAENALGGVAQAYADAIPLLLLPGGVTTARTQVPPNFDAVDNYRGITKWAANINQVERIPELMRRAFSQLVSRPARAGVGGNPQRFRCR